jgi:hypothetical protein
VGEKEDRLEWFGAVGTVRILTDGHVLVAVELPRQCPGCRRAHFDPRSMLCAKIRTAGERMEVVYECRSVGVVLIAGVGRRQRPRCWRTSKATSALPARRSVTSASRANSFRVAIQEGGKYGEIRLDTSDGE